MQNEELKEEDQIKIKTICEYIFFDQYQDTATFPRFEQCFQPLFNNISISIETVFKDICGEKKKYINYKRFAKAYLNHLNDSDPSNDTKIFFDTLLTKILKKPKSFIGKSIENSYSFSTVKSCKKRQCISLVEVLSDKGGKIHGINLEYDGVFKTKMYPIRIGDNLLVSLEMKLGIVDEKPLEENMLGKFMGIKKGNYVDAVTHIFGTYEEQSGLITFLGFKCISGKTVFVGFPEGDGFLFGKFGNKFHDIKVQMTDEGITKLEPGFKTNPRTNFFLGEMFKEINIEDLNKDELIKDEEELEKIDNEVEIDKLITTPIVEDDHFFNKKLKDEISGNDYKEVVNQTPRNWILRLKGAKKNQTPEKKSMSLMESLKIFNQEQELRAPSKLRAKKLRAKKRVLQNPNSGINDNPILRSGASGPINFTPPNQVMGHSTPWLHKTKIFRPKPRFDLRETFIMENNNGTLRSKKKFAWNGKIDKKTNPKIFLNKQNYIELKQKLGKLIHDEVAKQTEGNDEMKTVLLNQIIPDPGTSHSRLRSKKVHLGKRDKRKNFRLKMRNLKGEMSVYGEEKKFGTILRNKPAKSVENLKRNKKDENVVYSDGLQILNDMSEKKEKKENELQENNENSENNLFGFGGFTSSRAQDYNPFMGGYNHFGNFGYGVEKD